MTSKKIKTKLAETPFHLGGAIRLWVRFFWRFALIFVSGMMIVSLVSRLLESWLSPPALLVFFLISGFTFNVLSTYIALYRSLKSTEMIFLPSGRPAKWNRLETIYQFWFPFAWRLNFFTFLFIFLAVISLPVLFPWAGLTYRATAIPGVSYCVMFVPVSLLVILLLSWRNICYRKLTAALTGEPGKREASRGETGTASTV